MASDFGIIATNSNDWRQVSLTSGAATTLLDIPLPTAGDFCAGQLDFVVFCTDGTEYQNICCSTRFSAVNKNGTLTGDHTYVTTEESKNATGGTLTMTATDTTTATTTARFQITPTTSLTATTLIVRYRIRSMFGNTPSVMA